MDELLALLQEQAEQKPKQQEAGATTHTTQTSLTKNEDDDDAAVDDILERTSNPRSSKNENSKSKDNCSKDSNNKNDSLLSTLDIRIVQHLEISSVDMIDLISSSRRSDKQQSRFVTTAMLAAASWKQLNQYLVDPSPVLDAATVFGRTSLVTIGTIFESSGTRLCKSTGHAFCKLLIGTLTTGPCVTTLLFGAAYRHYHQQQQQQQQRTCHGIAGTVVALLNPRLMPGSNGDGAITSTTTTVTLSLNDAAQLIFVGRDGDYGTCQARVSGKNEHRQFVSNYKPCRNYVDKRRGGGERGVLFCAKHRNNSRQAKLADAGAATGNTLHLWRQQQRHQHYPNTCATSGNGGQRGHGKVLTLPNRVGSSLQQQSNINPSLSLSHADHMMAAFSQKHGSRMPTTATIDGGFCITLPSVTAADYEKYQWRQQQRCDQQAAAAAMITPPPSLPHKANNRLMSLSSSSSSQSSLSMADAQQQRHPHRKGSPPLSQSSTPLVYCSPVTSAAATSNGTPGVVTGGMANITHRQQLEQTSPHSKQQQRPFSTTTRENQHHTVPAGAIKSASTPTVSRKSSVKTMIQPEPLQQKQTSLSSSCSKNNKPADLVHLIMKPTSRNKKRGAPLAASLPTTALGTSNGRNNNPNKNNNKKRRVSNVNTDSIEGFNGSVMVPKPKVFGLLGKTGGSGILQLPPTSVQEQTEPVPDTRDAQKAARIITQQTQLAERLKEHSCNKLSSSAVKNNNKPAAVANKNTTFTMLQTFSRLGSSFTLDAKDIERSKYATSRFADQVQAESYAVQRRAMVELEQQEARQQRKSSGRRKASQQENGGRKEVKIQKRRHCSDCQRTFSYAPVSCQRQHHHVTMQRTVPIAQTSIAERRHAQNGQEDSLTLGAGLEWSWMQNGDNNA